ncbi:MAG TPA: hypothetical protein VFU21_01155 [Kofleriaceae bacterium]|nr:hypothetical protein [Kofleriaceae bacterium]
MMVRAMLVATTLGLWAAGCGGDDDGGGDGACSSASRSYTSFEGAGGAPCTGDGGRRECLAGDRCIEVGVCERVAPSAAPCDLLCARYDAFDGAGGPLCAGDQGTRECLRGDRCVSPGACEAVASAERPAPADCGPVGESYDSYDGAGGPLCAGDQGTRTCRPGDRCLQAGSCEIVLSILD